MRINIFFEEWDPNWKGTFSQCDKEVFKEDFKEHFKEQNFCMRIGPLKSCHKLDRWMEESRPVLSERRDEGIKIGIIRSICLQREGVKRVK